jgi:hypothetical protein
MLEKIVMAVIGAVAGGMITWSTKALTIEGRLDGIERAVVRIERKLERMQ